MGLHLPLIIPIYAIILQMTQEITISNATNSDLTKISELLTEMYGETRNTSDLEQHWEKYFNNNPNRTILVAHDSTAQNSIVGMLIINLVYKLPRIEARIDEVMVSEKARGKGIGTLLMEHAYAWSSEQNATIIEFTSRPSRVAANKLYQKLGYELRETNVYQIRI